MAHRWVTASGMAMEIVTVIASYDGDGYEELVYGSQVGDACHVSYEDSCSDSYRQAIVIAAASFWAARSCLRLIHQRPPYHQVFPSFAFDKRSLLNCAHLHPLAHAGHDGPHAWKLPHREAFCFLSCAHLYPLALAGHDGPHDRRPPYHRQRQPRGA